MIPTRIPARGASTLGDPVARRGRPRRAVFRGVALLLLVVAALGFSASAAFADATLVSVDPQPESVLDTSPKGISLVFGERVEVSLAGIRVYDDTGSLVDTGRPRHPHGRGNEVRVSLPNLHDGTYIVTWRVISADSHPVQASFSFQVGNRATVVDSRSLAARLLSTQRGSELVGGVYAVDRWLLFGGLALLIGAAVFVAAVDRRLRVDRRARRVVMIGWTAAALATVAGIGLEGAYGAARPMVDALDPSLFGDVLGTRYGKVALLRLLVLAVAVPLLLRLLRPTRTGESLPRWWWGAGAVTAVALALTPGLGGHATTGIWQSVAIPADAAHVLAMAVWIGGLVLLVLCVLGEVDDVPAREAASARFSAIALGCVGVLVATGVFQAWRQAGSVAALRTSDYGRVLLVKLGLVALVVVAAAFSREVVNRWRYGEPAVESELRELATVGAAVGAAVGGPAEPGASRTTGRVLPEGVALGDDDRHDEPADEWDDRGDSDRRRLRRSVFIEIAFLAVVLAASAILVNRAPARIVDVQPMSFTMVSKHLDVDIIIAPAVRGANDIHVTALDPSGTLTNVVDMQVQLSNRERNIAPITVALRRLAPGHYIVPAFDVPFGGTWQLTVRVTTGPTDEVVFTHEFTVR